MSGARNPNARVEDAPPPPYTETDIYSNSGVPSQASVDGDASHVSSATSGDPILTPPASPIAGSYFETRPLPANNAPTAPFMVHCISVDPDTLPEHVPYNSGLAQKGVTEQDWATFKNYLLPDHILRGNDALVDRKLRAEGRSEDGVSTGSSKSHAEAQLGGIHTSSDAGGEERMDPAQLRAHAISTVQEWNASFFGPRGVTIRLNPTAQQPAETDRMPGAWDQSFDDRSGPSDQPNRPGWRRHLDRVKVTDNMLRIGDSFLADVNGLKIGNMVMDGRGIRMDGSQPQPAPGFGDADSRGFPRGPPFGGPGFGRAAPPGGFGRGTPFGGWGGHGFGGGSHHHVVDGEQRGRSFNGGHGSISKQRSNSVSSSSSSDSSDSDSSLDSLPDYDEVSPAQLPVYADRLESWVNSPETIRTKQDLADLRAELKLVKRAGIDPDVDKKELRKHVKMLKGQWKGVRREQKRVLKERKREKRTRKRGERRERRERKREVKRSEREARREQRDCRREGRRERREYGGERRQMPTPFGFPGVPGVPGVPGAPGVPGVSSPPAPHAPYTPHAPYGRSGSWSGIFGNRGLFGPQGSFGPQVPGPHQTHSFSHAGVFPPHVGQSSSHPQNATRSAPPGSWPEDKKVNPEQEVQHYAGGQENGVVEASRSEWREKRLKELESELESKIRALDGMPEGKERKDAEKEIEALAERLDFLGEE